MAYVKESKIHLDLLKAEIAFRNRCIAIFRADMQAMNQKVQDIMKKVVRHAKPLPDLPSHPLSDNADIGGSSVARKMFFLFLLLKSRYMYEKGIKAKVIVKRLN